MRAGLGDGYVSLVDSLLAACRPHERIRVLNTGISGNRIIDLESRWRQDVLELKPDWLSVMIGINDVWRQFDRIHDSHPVTLERYEEIYRRLLERTRPEVKGLILMTPYYIETHRADPMREKMDAYGRVVERLSQSFDAVFVDLQDAFDSYLRYRPTQSLCGDRVHPNKTGHMLIAKAFLAAIDSE